MKPAGFVPEQVTKLPGRISAAATVRGGRGARLPARAPISVAPETERPFLSRRGGESFAKATVGNAFGYVGGDRHGKTGKICRGSNSFFKRWISLAGASSLAVSGPPR